MGAVYAIFIRGFGLPPTLLSLFAPPLMLFVIPFCGIACCRWLDGASVLNSALNFPENVRLFLRAWPDYLIASAFIVGVNSVTTAFFYTIPFAPSSASASSTCGSAPSMPSRWPPPLASLPAPAAPIPSSPSNSASFSTRCAGPSPPLPCAPPPRLAIRVPAGSSEIKTAARNPVRSEMRVRKIRSRSGVTFRFPWK